MKVKCPTCQKETEWSEQNPFRPFCSDRCKILDLGAWAMEKHAIPVDPSEQESESPSNLEIPEDDKNPKK